MAFDSGKWLAERGDDSDMLRLREAYGECVKKVTSPAENVAFPLEEHTNLHPDVIRAIVEEKLSLVDLAGFGAFMPAELSGGMKQRAALIRTLALKPEILLLDEPFSALDYQTRLLVSADICNLIRQTKKTVLIITHDLSEAISLADRIIILSKRPALVKKEIPIHLTVKKEDPLGARNAPEFGKYFKMLWEEISHENNQ